MAKVQSVRRRSASGDCGHLPGSPTKAVVYCSSGGASGERRAGWLKALANCRQQGDIIAGRMATSRYDLAGCRTDWLGGAHGTGSHFEQVFPVAQRESVAEQVALRWLVAGLRPRSMAVQSIRKASRNALRWVALNPIAATARVMEGKEACI